MNNFFLSIFDPIFFSLLQGATIKISPPAHKTCRIIKDWCISIIGQLDGYFYFIWWCSRRFVQLLSYKISLSAVHFAVFHHELHLSKLLSSSKFSYFFNVKIVEERSRWSQVMWFGAVNVVTAYWTRSAPAGACI